MLLFLSYADEDREVAREITDRLNQGHVRVCPSPESSGLGDLAGSGPESAISQADAFLALLSPDFLASSSCREERDLALRREQGRQGTGASFDFVQVLQIRQTPYHEAGLLQSRPWLDMTSQSARETTLSTLASRFGPGAPTPADGGGSSSGGNGGEYQPSEFRNRDNELGGTNGILPNLRSEDGKHFWLVIAPPQLGKSWFLREISTSLSGIDSRWTVRLVDLRDHTMDTLSSAEALLRIMFGAEGQTAAGPVDPQEIAINLLRKDESRLCLLDSAELLDDSIIRSLRSYVSQVISYMTEAGRHDVHIGLVVASRREGEWLNLTAVPRLHPCSLTEFSADIVFETLQKASQKLGRRAPSPSTLRQWAELVHRQSEGLPALLARYVAWIQTNEWTVSRQLDRAHLFTILARPYIEQELLSPRSLGGTEEALSDAQVTALEQALRALSPYRVITRSHLSHQASNGDLLDAMKAAGWSAEELWAAIGNTDLLFRPATERWLRIHDPIRRLLYRYWQASNASRRQAHHDASEFYRTFAPGQVGTDQGYFLVERLWHAVHVLLLSDPTGMAGELIGLCKQMSADFQMPSAEALKDLHDYTVRQMRADLEFVQADGRVAELLEHLEEAIRNPS